MKKLKFNKENILNLTVGIVCLGGFFFSLIYASFSEPDAIRNPSITEALLYKKTKAAKGYNAVFVYYVSNIKYENETTFEDINIIGQKYNIKYDRKNPSNARINFEEPIFTKTDNTLKTNAIITKLKTEMFSKKPMLVAFDYSVDYKKYNTYQYSKWDKFNLKVGDTCELEYLEDNPAICIIHLDKKIK
jgi:hypothetical protein